MASFEQVVKVIQNHWPVLGNVHRVDRVIGGFSGSCVWRVKAEAGLFAAKQWPSSISYEQMERIHASLRYLHSQGFTKVPVPIPNVMGQTAVFIDGSLWDLANWLPGQPCPRKPVDPVYIEQAMQVLAEFHQASVQIPRNMWQAPCEPIPVPALVRRTEMLKDWLTGRWVTLCYAFARSKRLELAELSAELINRAGAILADVAEMVNFHSRYRFPVHPVGGDIWRGNVLFEGPSVSALVDFTAMRIDASVVDVVRLLSSLAVTGQDWQLGLRVYRDTAPPVSLQSLLLVDVVYRSAVLLSALNWLWWIYVEDRKFENFEAAIQRLHEIRGDLLSLHEVTSALE